MNLDERWVETFHHEYFEAESGATWPAQGLVINRSHDAAVRAALTAVASMIETQSRAGYVRAEFVARQLERVAQRIERVGETVSTELAAGLVRQLLTPIYPRRRGDEMNIDDTWVEQLARARYAHSLDVESGFRDWEDLPEWERDLWLDATREADIAMTPLIAARALRSEAEALRMGDCPEPGAIPQFAEVYAAWLQDRADRIETEGTGA